MAKQGVTIEGDEELIRKMRNLGDAVKGSQPERLYLRAAKVIRDDAKERAPVGPTGNLRRGIVAKVLDRMGRKVAPAMVGINFRIAPHAHLLEFGTVKMSPRAFFRPAVRAQEQRVKDILRKGFKKIIEKAARKRALV